MVTRTSMAAKLLIALGLFRDGEALMRQNLRRSRPGASDHEVEQDLLAWVRIRPGAVHGDCPGRLTSLDR